MEMTNKPVARTSIQEETLTALENLYTEKSTWQSQIKTLGLYLLAFIVVGWILISLSTSSGMVHLFIVIGMLFIHEAGHYLSMRHFGYRNLKMFFIPFFGAAVSGYACVPVTQAAIVYLLGPVPGILLGCLFGLVYLLTQESLWFDTAKIFITINTINLLPLYPLDGGRFVFDMLPQKTYRIQWLFQLALVILSVYVFWNLSARILGNLLGFVLVQLWHLHKHNKIAALLIESGIIRTRSRKAIPAEIALEMIPIVQREMGHTSANEIAAATWAAWTRIRAKRPTTREQIYLIATYLGMLALGMSIWFVYFSAGGN